MGQTLSNGVYLPNEGERNCYAGLASNWQILNTAVGNIAEKAPLVHTHGNISSDGKVGATANLPLITGTSGTITTGSFGNTANTFCEGNDSRLSDARTPVAHTHTKSDVTDLLNSDFIPSVNNSYDLGSSSYQWNNLYAKRVNTQSVNGINPGALSLPDVRAAAADPVDTVNWSLTGSRNTYTPTEDGWFFIRVAGTDGCSVNVHSGSASNDYPTWSNSSTAGDTTLVVPAGKGITLYVYVKATSISYCSFRPCLGNV